MKEIAVPPKLDWTKATDEIRNKVAELRQGEERVDIWPYSTPTNDDGNPTTFTVFLGAPGTDERRAIPFTIEGEVGSISFVQGQQGGVIPR